MTHNGNNNIRKNTFILTSEITCITVFTLPQPREAEIVQCNGLCFSCILLFCGSVCRGCIHSILSNFSRKKHTCESNSNASGGKNGRNYFMSRALGDTPDDAPLSTPAEDRGTGDKLSPNATSIF